MLPLKKMHIYYYTIFIGYAFWALVFALSVIALCNFFLTVTIFR